MIDLLVSCAAGLYLCSEIKHGKLETQIFTGWWFQFIEVIIKSFPTWMNQEQHVSNQQLWSFLSWWMFQLSLPNVTIWKIKLGSHHIQKPGNPLPWNLTQGHCFSKECKKHVLKMTWRHQMDPNGTYMCISMSKNTDIQYIGKKRLAANILMILIHPVTPRLRSHEQL